jgi:methionyl-tRNA formyltransferase
MERSHKPFAFFGTPYVARDTLAILLERGYVPEVVITGPDAARGRGMEVSPCETRVLAEEQGLPVLTPRRIDDEAMARIAGYGCRYAIVVAYGKILPQALIDAFPDGILNVHYSLLPKYRGASPVEGALLAGETETGVSIQRMVFELDAGDVLATERTPIGPEETTRELRPRLVLLGADLLARTLPSFEDGTAAFTAQDHAQATRSGKIRKEEGLLRLGEDDRLAWNKYRAYAESPGTYFFMERDGARLRVKVRTARMEGGRFVPDRVVPEGKGEGAYASLLAAGWQPV